MHQKHSTLTRLRDLDKKLHATIGVPRSLASNRTRATSLQDLGMYCFDYESPQVVILSLNYLTIIVEAQMAAFPENIFWDNDFLAGSMIRGAQNSKQYEKWLLDFSQRMVKLIVSFGRESPIRFRYIHDFTYGFDWAKWATRQPDKKSYLGPFDIHFLDYMLERAQDITQNIVDGNEESPPLAPGAYRNPFPFSREPPHEMCLLENLVKEQLIPVHAWNFHAKPSLSLPYNDTRVTQAEALQIPSNPCK